MNPKYETAYETINTFLKKKENEKHYMHTSLAILRMSAVSLG
jgi:hypothetical protein